LHAHNLSIIKVFLQKATMINVLGDQTVYVSDGSMASLVPSSIRHRIHSGFGIRPMKHIYFGHV